MRNLNAYDLFEARRAQAEAAMRRDAMIAQQAQGNASLSQQQRQNLAFTAQQSQSAHEGLIAANQSQHERNLQNASMEHRYADHQLQRDLSADETKRDQNRWSSIRGMLGAGGMGVSAGATPGISLYSSSGSRIGGTSMGAMSPLSGLTRK
jgi:hypothetical protein